VQWKNIEVCSWVTNTKNNDPKTHIHRDMHADCQDLKENLMNCLKTQFWPVCITCCEHWKTCKPCFHVNQNNNRHAGLKINFSTWWPAGPVSLLS